MGQYTKEDAIRIVTACAKLYEEHLAGKNLLFVCQNKHRVTTEIELSFDASNFLHLTGLKLKKQSTKTGEDESISAKVFYEKCLSHKLSVRDFEFAPDGTTPLKLDVLPRMMCKNLSANMIGNYNGRNPKLFTEKLAGSTVACMGFVPTGSAKRLVPNTVLKADIRDYTENQLRVIAAFRKNVGESGYRELTYLAKNVDWNRVILSGKNQYLEKLLPEKEEELVTL